MLFTGVLDEYSAARQRIQCDGVGGGSRRYCALCTNYSGWNSNWSSEKEEKEKSLGHYLGAILSTDEEREVNTNFEVNTTNYDYKKTTNATHQLTRYTHLLNNTAFL